MRYSTVVVLVVLQLMLPLVANAADGDAKIYQFDAHVTDNSGLDSNLANIANTKTTIDEINSVSQAKQEEDLINKKVDNNLINIIESGSEKNVNEGSNLDEYNDLRNKISDVFDRLILAAPGDNTNIINAPVFGFDRMYENDMNMDFALLINQGFELPTDQIKPIQFDVPTPPEVSVVEAGKE